MNKLLNFLGDVISLISTALGSIISIIMTILHIPLLLFAFLCQFRFLDTLLCGAALYGIFTVFSLTHPHGVIGIFIFVMIITFIAALFSQFRENCLTNLLSAISIFSTIGFSIYLAIVYAPIYIFYIVLMYYAGQIFNTIIMIWSPKKE
ncbi:MAG: hypothetical protein IKM48_08540 [Clostridia bacterium]|nr:hypothetical protein [Clostridia bacterium]